MPKLAEKIMLDPNTGSVQIDGEEFGYYLSSDFDVFHDVRPLASQDEETGQIANATWSVVWMPVMCEQVEIVPPGEGK